jgi:heme/copper-type cytochrome/quinol oxidase subunit 2
MEGIINFHHELMYILFGILCCVICMLSFCLDFFSNLNKANEESEKIAHQSLVEII